jgi:hypothetical protein
MATVMSSTLLAVAAQPHAATGTPAIVVVVALAAALVVLLAGLWLLARWSAWEPSWWQHLGHVSAEAGFHAETTWAEFRDWLRLGR